MRAGLYAAVSCVLAGVSVFGISRNAAAETGENSYLLECQGCHARDGQGAVDTVPTLRGEMAKFLLVEGGREFLVQVPGSAQSPLTDQELADTLNWMLAQFGPADIARQHPPYTATEVAGLRAEPLVEVQVVRETLVAAINRAN